MSKSLFVNCAAFLMVVILLATFAVTTVTGAPEDPDDKVLGVKAVDNPGPRQTMMPQSLGTYTVGQSVHIDFENVQITNRDGKTSLDLCLDSNGNQGTQRHTNTYAVLAADHGLTLNSNVLSGTVTWPGTPPTLDEERTLYFWHSVYDTSVGDDVVDNDGDGETGDSCYYRFKFILQVNFIAPPKPTQPTPVSRPFPTPTSTPTPPAEDRPICGYHHGHANNNSFYVTGDLCRTQTWLAKNRYHGSSSSAPSPHYGQHSH